MRGIWRSTGPPSVSMYLGTRAVGVGKGRLRKQHYDQFGISGRIFGRMWFWVRARRR